MTYPRPPSAALFQHIVLICAVIGAPFPISEHSLAHFTTFLRACNVFSFEILTIFLFVILFIEDFPSILPSRD